jgi:chemotaxis protein CheD
LKNIMTQEFEKFLGIGEYLVTTRPTKVRTILGSCISVTMHHHATGYGAICHASLPVTPAGAGVDYRYIDQLIPTMTRWFDRHKIPREELKVKLFGGGEMYGNKAASGDSVSVGRKNVIMARKVLRGEGLELAASDVGGRHGRALTFHTSTGEVWVRKNPGRGNNQANRPPGKKN